MILIIYLNKYSGIRSILKCGKSHHFSKKISTQLWTIFSILSANFKACIFKFAFKVSRNYADCFAHRRDLNLFFFNFFAAIMQIVF